MSLEASRAAIAEREAVVRAWVCVTESGVSGRTTGPLAGVALGVKDVFDTRRPSDGVWLAHLRRPSTGR